jgi:anti-sigma regulatory factor (Ser/Thr protein kinase)
VQAQQKVAYRLWRFEGAELRESNLVPTLTRSICRQFNVASERTGDLELVLTEVIANSIDHGILGLDSTMKKDPTGFERYFLTRTAMLSALTEGVVEVSIDQPEPDIIRIAVQDSGNGFPYPTGSLEGMPESLLLAYGRGVLIIQKLCRSVTHIGNGNCVVLHFAIY